MEQHQKLFLKENLPKLIKSTNCTEYLLAILLKQNILLQEDIDDLKSIQHERAQVGILYDLLQDKGLSFDGLQHVMQEAGQHDACSILGKCEIANIFRYRSISYKRSLLVGAGYYGSNVYQGHYDSKKVAVKKIYHDHITSKSLMEGQVKKLIESKSHLNDRVVEYFGAEYGDEFILIAMELTAANLDHWVGRKSSELPFNPLDLLRQITEGVKHLHSRGVIHGNLHPANVLISQPGSNNIFVRLSDFGLVDTIKCDGNKRDMFLSGFGTGKWTAPEIIRYIRRDDDAGTPDNSADIFSLGCLFYYILSRGKHPFANGAQQMGNILNDIVTISESELTVIDVNALSFIWLIRQMISRRTVERPPATAIVSHPVFWPNKRVVQFLHDVVPFVENHSSLLDNCTCFVTRNGTEPGMVQGDPTTIQKYLSRQGHPKENKLSSLLKLIPDMGPPHIIKDMAYDYPHVWLSQFPYLLPVAWTVFQFENDSSLTQKYYGANASFRYNLVRKSGKLFEIFPLPQLDSEKNRCAFLGFAKVAFELKIKEQIPLENNEGDSSPFYDDDAIKKKFQRVKTELLGDIEILLSFESDHDKTTFKKSFDKIYESTLNSYLTKNDRLREHAEKFMNAVVEGLLADFKGQLEEHFSGNQTGNGNAKLEEAFQNCKSAQLESFQLTKKSCAKELHNEYTNTLETKMTDIFTELKILRMTQTQSFLKEPEHFLEEDINQYEIELNQIAKDGRGINEAGLRMIHSLKVASVIDRLEHSHPLQAVTNTGAEIKVKLQDRLHKIFDSILAVVGGGTSSSESARNEKDPRFDDEDELDKLNNSRIPRDWDVYLEYSGTNQVDGAPCVTKEVIDGISPFISNMSLDDLKQYTSSANSEGKEKLLDKLKSKLESYASQISLQVAPERANQKFILEAVDDSKEELGRRLGMEVHPELKGNITTTSTTPTWSEKEPCPVKLIQFVHNDEGTTIELQQEALDSICLEIGDRPLCIISICGPARQGKSFLLGYVIRRLVGLEQGLADWMGWEDVGKPLQGFAFRNGREPETKGIWIWSRPFVIKTEEDNEVAVLLLDTQETNDEFTNDKDMSAIFGLSLLLSSVTVFNCFANLQEDLLLLQLNTYIEYGNMVLDQERSGGPPFQKLTFLIRDFNNPDEFPYGDGGGELFLNHALRVNNHHSPEARHVLENIPNCFQELGCFLMPNIGEDAKSMKFEGSIAELDVNFAAKMEEFINNLVCPRGIIKKQILGNPVHGTGLKTLLRTYIEIFNSDEIPSARNIWQATAQLSNLNLLEKAIKRYHDHMKAELTKNPYLSDAVLDNAHIQEELNALNWFRKSRKVGSSSLILDFEENLAIRIGNAYLEMKEDNIRRREAYITTSTLDAIHYFRRRLLQEFPFPKNTVFYDVRDIKDMAKLEESTLIKRFKDMLPVDEEDKLWDYTDSILNSMRTILDNHLNINHMHQLNAETHMTVLIDDLLNEYKIKLREYLGKSYYEADNPKHVHDEIKSTDLHECGQQELQGREDFHMQFMARSEKLMEVHFNMLTNKHSINIVQLQQAAAHCVANSYSKYLDILQFEIQKETTMEGLLLCHEIAMSTAVNELNAKHGTMDPFTLKQCEADLLQEIEESFPEREKLFETIRTRKDDEAAVSKGSLARAEATAVQTAKLHAMNMAQESKRLQAAAGHTHKNWGGASQQKEETLWAQFEEIIRQQWKETYTVHERLLMFHGAMRDKFAIQNCFTKCELEECFREEYDKVIKMLIAGNSEICQWVKFGCDKLMGYYRQQNNEIIQNEEVLAKKLMPDVFHFYDVEMTRYLSDGPYLPDELKRIHLCLVDQLGEAFETAFKFTPTDKVCENVPAAVDALKDELGHRFTIYLQQNQAKSKTVDGELSNLLGAAKSSYLSLVDNMMKGNPEGLDPAEFVMKHDQIVTETKDILKTEIGRKTGQERYLEANMTLLQTQIDAHWAYSSELNWKMTKLTRGRGTDIPVRVGEPPKAPVHKVVEPPKFPEPTGETKNKELSRNDVGDDSLAAAKRWLLEQSNKIKIQLEGGTDFTIKSGVVRSMFAKKIQEAINCAQSPNSTTDEVEEHRVELVKWSSKYGSKKWAVKWHEATTSD